MPVTGDAATLSTCGSTARSVPAPPSLLKANVSPAEPGDSEGLRISVDQNCGTVDLSGGDRGTRKINDSAGRKRDLAGKIRRGVKLERAVTEKHKSFRVGRAYLERAAAADRCRPGAGNGVRDVHGAAVGLKLAGIGSASSMVSVPPPVASNTPELVVWLPVSMTISPESPAFSGVASTVP